MPTPPTYPARAVHRGRLELAPPKRGLWLFESKFNGYRTLVHVPTVTMWNRQGERLTIAAEFSKALAQMKAEFDKVATGTFRSFNPENDEKDTVTAAEVEWANCEALERRHRRGQGCLVLLDLPLLKRPLKERGYIMRNCFCPAIDHCASRDSVYNVPQYTDGHASYEDAKEMNKQLGCQFYEGVVARRLFLSSSAHLTRPRVSTLGQTPI